MDINGQTKTHKQFLKKKCGIPGIRYLFTVMGFLGFCVLFSLRVNLNIAIVAMVNNSVVNDSYSDDCPVVNSTEDTPTNEGEFNWSLNLQAIVLGSFYIGYSLFQIPGGRVAEIYGAKNTFGCGVLISSITSLFTPMAARYHIYFLIATRFIAGAAQGVTYPSMYSLIGKWLPESEKGLLSTIIRVGMNIGTIVAMPLSGILCDSNFLGGWPSVFYVFGFFGCLWFILWIVLVSETPMNHPCITETELKYIVKNQNIKHLEKLPPIPWKSILTSVPFWAVVITQFGHDYAFFTLLNDLPTFMSKILHFKIESNGILSALPSLFQTIVGFLTGFITDIFIRRKWVSIAFVRKFCTTFGSIAESTAYIGVCLAGCNVEWTVAMFAISSGFGGITYCGYTLSNLDLSPEYAGTLMGITNCISSLTGYIAPAVIAALTSKNQTLQAWRIVFYIVVGILIITTIIYFAFSSAEKQNWISPRKFTILDEDEVYLSNNYETVQNKIHYDDYEASFENSTNESENSTNESENSQNKY